MKRTIFLIISMFVMVAITEAQMLTTTLVKGESYANVTTNYVLSNTTPKYWQVNAQPEWFTAQDVIVNIDSTSGNLTNLAVAFYGRKSDQLTWTQIGSTVNWKGTVPGTGADTTITIANTTEAGYRQFKVLFTGTGTGTATIDRMELKLYNGIP